MTCQEGIVRSSDYDVAIRVEAAGTMLVPSYSDGEVLYLDIGSTQRCIEARG